MKKDINKEVTAIIRATQRALGDMAERAERDSDAETMAYARAGEYYVEMIVGCINWIRRLSVVMDIKIEAESDKACQEIKTLADIWAVEGSDKMLAERHNKLINSTKKHIHYMLTLCSREGSPLHDLTDNVVQLDKYADKMREDLAKKREKLKKLRMKRVERKEE